MHKSKPLYKFSLIHGLKILKMSRKIYDHKFSTTPCKWSLNPTQLCPHTKEIHKPRGKICENVTELIGNTPIVRINHLTKQAGIVCEVLAKCEFLNPGGSVKDRTGARLITDLEKLGKLRPGMTIVETTSGNTGIGLGITASAKGYNLIATMKDVICQEKVDILTALGASIYKGPSNAPITDDRCYVARAEILERENSDIIMTGQYYSPSNPLAHYDHTAEEMLDQCDNKIDYVFVGVGTGGQITGISRKLKENLPNVKIIGVDPEGSVNHDPENANYHWSCVEGIGSPIQTRVLYTDAIDQ